MVQERRDAPARIADQIPTRFLKASQKENSSKPDPSDDRLRRRIWRRQPRRISTPRYAQKGDPVRSTYIVGRNGKMIGMEKNERKNILSIEAAVEGGSLALLIQGGGVILKREE